MAVQVSTTSAPAIASRSSDISKVYREGIVAGVIGAAVMALWLFVLDIFSARPLYTPSVLGTALLRRGIELGQLQPLPVSFETGLSCTRRHAMGFFVLGVLLG